jgi:2-phospho-L-lactate transferase/gluconeogenesis factor (CofD/UPF0052 family)
MSSQILKRLSPLGYLARPLALIFVGIVLLSLGVAYLVIALYREAAFPAFFYYLTLQFLDRWVRGAALGLAGLLALGLGIWKLSGMVVIPLGGLDAQQDLVLNQRRTEGPPQVVVLSGGAGMLVLAGLGRQSARLTCITPVQDPVEYYYRAASLFSFENVIYVPPSPAPAQVEVRLDDGSQRNIKQRISHDERLADRHVVQLYLRGGENGESDPQERPIFRQAQQAIEQADLIIFGPGSLFESVLPNLLIRGVREAIQRSRARKIYICNLMTEPGLTTGFSVADHIRQFRRLGGFVPDYVLVNAQRIEPDIRQIYEAAHQTPVYLSPEEYEETSVAPTERAAARDVVVEGAVVIEADLASAVVESTTSLEHPGRVRAVRVLRHDPDKLTAAILQVLRVRG